eukprot:404115-Amorphochlora_amoeboformis.AAC.1
MCDVVEELRPEVLGLGLQLHYRRSNDSCNRSRNTDNIDNRNVDSRYTDNRNADSRYIVSRNT